MKNVLLSVFILSSLLQSCSDILTEDNPSENNLQTRSLAEEENAIVSTVSHNGENLLRFKDIEAYNNIIQMMNSQTNEERIEFTNSLHVKTITALLAEADRELDKICESSTITDFRPQYEQYKKVYDDIFMFNDSNPEDLSAYSKLKNPMDDNIANKWGEFMIGDSLVQANEFTNFSEFNSSNIVTYATYETSTYNKDVNHAWSHWDKRKVGLYLSLDVPQSDKYMGITMRLTAQKKFVFGWKRYSTEYHARFELKGSGTGFEFCESTYFGYPGEKYVNKNNQEFVIHTRELDGNFSVLFGRVGYQAGPVLYNFSCSGRMEIWSRGIGEDGRGIASVDLHK